MALRIGTPKKTPAKVALIGQEKLSSRERLLNAGKELFAKYGFEKTSTVEIARAAGTSESQLMKHFGSKEGLMEALFDKGWTPMTDSLLAIHQIPSGREKLQWLLNLVLATVDRDPQLKHIMMLEGRRIRREGAVVRTSGPYMKIVQIVDAILAEMRSAGELRGDLSLEAVRSAILGMFEGLIRDQVMADRMNFPARYTADDIKKIFPVVLKAFAPR
jgi:AcrR family transcriptional regulator